MAKEIQSLPNLDQFLNNFTNKYSILSQQGGSYLILFIYSDKSDTEFNNLISDHFDKLLNFSSDYYKFSEYYINYSEKFIFYQVRKIHSNTTTSSSQSKINNLAQFKNNFLTIQAPEKSIHFSQSSKNKTSVHYSLSYKDLDSSTFKTKIVDTAKTVSTFNPPDYNLSIFSSRVKDSDISILWSE